MIRIQSSNGVALNGNYCYQNTKKEANAKKNIGAKDPDKTVYKPNIKEEIKDKSPLLYLCA